MAALSITAANVVKGANAVTEIGVAGEAVTAGQTVYKRASDGKYMLADCNSATVEARAARGIALNNAAADQPLVIQTGGSITIGATVTVGTIYCGGDVAGGIIPSADLTSGEFVTVLGVATSASVIALGINNFNAALA